jgi:hypothetical protein
MTIKVFKTQDLVRTINGVEPDDFEVALTTDNIPEAVVPTNLYYTDTRARASVSADPDSALVYDELTGEFSIDPALGAVTGINGETGNVTLTTGDIAEGEGSSNGAEGGNKWFTTARARESVSAGNQMTYTQLTGVIDFDDTVEDQIISSVGLTANTGALPGYANNKYIADEDSLVTALDKIDLQLFTTQGEIDAEETARANAVNNLQGQINTEKGRIDAILAASNADYDTFVEIVALINSVDLTNDNALAAAVAALQGNIDAEATTRGNADNAINEILGDLDTSVGTVDGVKGNYSANNYIANEDSHQVALGKLDAQLKLDHDAVVSAQTDLDALEAAYATYTGNVSTSIGDTNGDGVKNNYANQNYILHADALVTAISKLDAQLFLTQGDLDTAEADIAALDGRLDTAESDIDTLQADLATAEGKISNMITASGFNVDGTKPNFTSTNIINAGDSLYTAIDSIDAALTSLSVREVVTTIAVGAFPYTIAAPASDSILGAIYLADNGANAVSVTLPTADIQAGFKLTIKRLGTNTVTINRAGADTIDGQTSIDLMSQYSSVLLVNDGSNWHIV